MSAMAMPDSGTTRSGDAFMDLVLADDDLVRLEFEAIVSAEWGGEPPRPAMPAGDRPAHGWPLTPAGEGGPTALGPGRRPPAPITRERAPPSRTEL